MRETVKESAAVLALAEPELREAIGHTNFAVFKLRIQEAGALLDQSSTWCPCDSIDGPHPECPIHG